MTTSRTGRLQLHRAERADALVRGLAGVLAIDQPDPLVREVVAVPARGVERWLTQRLSYHLGSTEAAGICANVDFPSPGQLVADCVAAAGGAEPDDDPWAPLRLVWTLLDMVDGEFPAPRGDRRFLVARHLGRFFTSYGEQRPTMLTD
ncbi:MAG: exodeoxyribonuclease V subunit gamma, partial [Nocardioidaceae bacterium]|nr:exodeoxyribonuclease V subunit gamma [Nocardioidaceae bacterium]